MTELESFYHVNIAQYIIYTQHGDGNSEHIYYLAMRSLSPYLYNLKPMFRLGLCLIVVCQRRRHFSQTLGSSTHYTVRTALGFRVMLILLHNP